MPRHALSPTFLDRDEHRYGGQMALGVTGKPTATSSVAKPLRPVSSDCMMAPDMRRVRMCLVWRAKVLRAASSMLTTAPSLISRPRM